MDDVWHVILGNTNDVYTYKHTYLTCKHFVKSYNTVNRSIKLKYSNSLYVLLKLFPDKPWDWERLSYNPNITWQIVLDNQDKPWDWLGLSCNPNITWQIVSDNLD